MAAATLFGLAKERQCCAAVLAVLRAHLHDDVAAVHLVVVLRQQVPDDFLLQLTDLRCRMLCTVRNLLYCSL